MLYLTRLRPLQQKVTSAFRQKFCPRCHFNVHFYNFQMYVRYLRWDFDKKCFSDCFENLKIIFDADSFPRGKWWGIFECVFLSSVNTFLFYFSSHLISISVVFYFSTSSQKSWNYLFQKEVRRGFWILPLGDITINITKEIPPTFCL